MKLSEIRLLRRIALPLLRLSARDISMRHPLVPEVQISLNSFKHKGYWYFRRHREYKTMALFNRLIAPGAHVVEVGGHIGFISIHFLNLIGPQGRLTVFEPGSNNLRYIQKNLDAARLLGGTCNLVAKAVGDQVGEARFYEDDLSGQNNSLLQDFVGLKQNAKSAFVPVKTMERVVPLTTLDAEIGSDPVDFIKIDVEGAEKSVVLGAINLIDHQKPVMMIEVQANEADLYYLLTDRNWAMFNDHGAALSYPSALQGNVFVLHRDAHKDLLNEVFQQPAMGS